MRVLNDDEELRNYQYSGFGVVTVLSGLRLSITLMQVHFNRSSLKKFQPALSSVQILGKLTRVSLHEDSSIVSLIMVNDNIPTVKEIISMA